MESEFSFVREGATLQLMALFASLRESPRLRDVELAAMRHALALHQGNRTHAAKALGISVRTLQRKLKNDFHYPVSAAVD